MTGKGFISGWKRAVLTVALAYALALQALLLSLSGALQAGAVDLPQAILCVGNTGHSSDHHQAPGPGHDALCCTLGCHGAGSPGGPPPAVAVPAHPPVAVASVSIPEAPALRLASDVLPVGSRAPPRLG